MQCPLARGVSGRFGYQELSSSCLGTLVRIARMFRAHLLDIVEEPGTSCVRLSNTVKEPCKDGWRVQLLDGACADDQSDLLSRCL
jgi:hypothetical protein